MTTLFTISHDPFEPWKSATRTWQQARARGMRIFVALDDRTSVEDALRVGALADQVRPWTSAGHCEDAYALVPEVDDDFIFLVSDDEEPSDLCWRLALEPPFVARFGIPVIPILDGRMWRRDIGVQERLFPTDGWSWSGGFEGTSSSPHRAVAIGHNPGVVIWHRYLVAPRAAREEKAARYERLSPGPEHRRRLIWEDDPDGLVPMPDYMSRHLPRARERMN